VVDAGFSIDQIRRKIRRQYKKAPIAVHNRTLARSKAREPPARPVQFIQEDRDETRPQVDRLRDRPVRAGVWRRRRTGRQHSARRGFIVDEGELCRACLGRIGPAAAAAIPTLEAAEQDPDRDVANAARSALRQVRQ
jgi:hypothetical protein